MHEAEGRETQNVFRGITIKLLAVVRHGTCKPRNFHTNYRSARSVRAHYSATIVVTAAANHIAHRRKASLMHVFGRHGLRRALHADV